MSDPIDIFIGERVCERRKSAGLTQVQLGDQIGCRGQQVQKYEAGQNRIAGSRLYMIARAVGCDVGEFFPPANTQAENGR